jgi:hypothetical protein
MQDEYELRDAIRDLEREAAGEPYTEDQKRRWNDLKREARRA